MTGSLHDADYRPQFSGHETFPLRYGWLHKACAAVEAEDGAQSVFHAEDAIARFGVGKNMVASIRHWALASGILTTDAEIQASEIRAKSPQHFELTPEISGGGRFSLTPLGRRLFSGDGLDPYLEHPASLWLIHWNLCSTPDRTTWHWVFNHCTAPYFGREDLVESLIGLARERGWKRSASGTVKRDVECFVRTYAPRSPTGRGGQEEALESPLVELGLIQATARNDVFRTVRGPKPSLGMGVFTYALAAFWNRFAPGSETLNFETLAHEPGSPARAFLLDEDDLSARMNSLSRVTAGVLTWSETAGLRQILRRGALPAGEDALAYIEADYPEAPGRSAGRRAA